MLTLVEFKNGKEFYINPLQIATITIMDDFANIGINGIFIAVRKDDNLTDLLCNMND